MAAVAVAAAVAVVVAGVEVGVIARVAVGVIARVTRRKVRATLSSEVVILVGREAGVMMTAIRAAIRAANAAIHATTGMPVAVAVTVQNLNGVKRLGHGESRGMYLRSESTCRCDVVACRELV